MRALGKSKLQNELPNFSSFNGIFKRRNEERIYWPKDFPAERICFVGDCPP
jgi:hypothetical protein